MASLKDTALAYEPPQTLNIADLEKVPIDIEEFSYKYAKLNNKEYRIPNSVLEEIQTILKLKPTVAFVKVTKTGSGLATRYKVNPL
jgi:hypothetical protein